MNRLIRLVIAAWFLFAAPAYAGIAIISGGGTGGSIGTANAGSGSTTLALTTSVDVPAGSLIVVAGANRNSGSFWQSCTDAAGNTYTAAHNSIFNALPAIRVFYSYTASFLANGSSITCTASATATNKTIAAAAFSGVSSSPFDATALATTSGSSGITFSVTSGSPLACPGSGNCELLIGAVAYGSATLTPDASFTSLGNITSNAFMQWGYKFVTTNSAVTFAPTDSTSTSYAESITGYVQNVVAGTSPRRSLVGIGQ